MQTQVCFSTRRWSRPFYQEDSRMSRTAAKEPENHSPRTVENPEADLRKSPMMAHLLDALNDGKDIGHYGRLTFVMVARHFMDEEDLVTLLSRQPDQSEESV